MNLTYLASPYSVGNADAAKREQRFRHSCQAAARLMQTGENIFCPIAHSHPIEVHGMNGAIEGHDFWLKQDFAVLKHCSKMIVVMMEGWMASTGIKREMDVAKHIGIPIEYIDPSDLGIVE